MSQAEVLAETPEGPLVQVEGIRKSFGQNVVLDGIDLEVAAGEALVVIGASGSGKSTLLRCINLLEPIDSGRIFLEGKEITGKGAKVAAIRQRIGIVFQQFNLFPHLKAIDNVTLAARRVRKMPRREAEAKAHELHTAVRECDVRSDRPVRARLRSVPDLRLRDARVLRDLVPADPARGLPREAPRLTSTRRR